MANVISTAKKIAVITALVEGCSVRSTVRMTGVSKGAVLRLLVSVGAACAEYQNRVIRNVAPSAFRLMKSGRLSGARKRTSPLPRRKLGLAETFGRSLRLKRRPSS
jgi:hypothetical protein